MCKTKCVDKTIFISYYLHFRYHWCSFNNSNGREKITTTIKWQKRPTTGWKEETWSNGKDDSLSRQISNVHESIVERSEDVCNSEDIFTFTGLKFKRSKNLRLQKWLKKFIPNKIPSVLEHYMYLRTKRDVLFSTLLFLTLSWSHTMEIKRKITA